MLTNALTFLQMYKDVASGEMTYPRGTRCRERTDYMLPIDMRFSPLTSFNARNLNLKYAKEEFKWYMRADKFDRSIEEHATMWQKIRQPDGSYFSNYGQYIWPNQFWFVINELIADEWSRRATIVLLREEHLFHHNTDIVCTYSINFRIRDGALDMSVNMRSNDVIFGATNDIFCFSMLYRMVFAYLQRKYEDLMKGVYVHKVDSLHVYERHFDMIKNIIEEGINGYYDVPIPWPTHSEITDCDGPWFDWLNA